MKTLATILIVLAGFSPVIQAADSVQSRIDGVTEFLIDRANENYLYFFENAIKENRDLKCYFGKTVANLELGGLKELLISNGLWKTSLEKDFKGIKNKATLWVVSHSLELIENTVDRIVVKNEDAINKLNELGSVKGELAGKNATDQLQAVKDAVEYFSKFNSDDSDELKGQLCKVDYSHSETIEKHIKVLVSIKDTLVDTINLKEDAKKDKALALLAGAGAITVAKKAKPLTKESVQEDLAKLSEKLEEIDALAKTFDDEKEGYTVKTIAAFDLLRQYTIESGDKSAKLEEKLEEAQENVNKIKRHVLFFAQVADADNSIQIKGILTAYTLPAISFFEKRDNTRHWFVSAYLGVSATVNDNGVKNDYKQEKIFAPIGLEYSWGAPSLAIADSVSIMVAPFDFGYPVNLKLKDVEKDVDYDEIFAPSISINFGVKKAPVAWGFVFQRGLAYDASGKQDYRAMMHISFDMPLFVF